MAAVPGNHPLLSFVVIALVSAAAVATYWWWSGKQTDQAEQLRQTDIEAARIDQPMPAVTGQTPTVRVEHPISPLPDLLQTVVQPPPFAVDTQALPPPPQHRDIDTSNLAERLREMVGRAERAEAISNEQLDEIRRLRLELDEQRTQPRPLIRSSGRQMDWENLTAALDEVTPGDDDPSNAATHMETTT